MHQLLGFKSKFPNHFAFTHECLMLTAHAIFGPDDLVRMLTIVIYLVFIVVATYNVLKKI